MTPENKPKISDVTRPEQIAIPNNLRDGKSMILLDRGPLELILSEAMLNRITISHKNIVLSFFLIFTYKLLYTLSFMLLCCVVLRCVADPCLVRWWGKGRECVVAADGTAACLCQRTCPSHGRVVCGTDGLQYPNHCQLHRASCIQGRNLNVDHSFSCTKPRKKPPSKSYP